MKSLRYLLLVALLVLLAAGAIRGGEAVLVPGNPPLTRGTMDGFRKMFEYLLNIELTPAQRSQWESLVIAHFQKNAAIRQRLVSTWQKYPQELERLSSLTEPERTWVRVWYQLQWIGCFRTSTAEVDRFMLQVYDAAYRPGRPNNPILVAGEPPLTKALMDRRFVYLEWVLDLRLSHEQRAEYQRLFIKEWQRSNKAQKEGYAKLSAGWGEAIPSWTAYQRNCNRSGILPRSLADWGKKDADEASRWLGALYEAAYKVGGPRNRVLVKGDPALTQAVVDHYGDYVEWALDLSASGGLSGPQRQVLKDYLVRDWKKMDRPAKEEILNSLKRGAEVALQNVDEQNKWRAALQPKLVADLRAARADARSQWLLQIYDKERQLVARFRQQKVESER